MVTPTWSWLLTKWSFEPSIVVGMLALNAVYLLAGGFLSPAWFPRLRFSTRPTPNSTAYFIASQAVLGVALLSPLDLVGDDFLFSAHMVQHLLLLTLWPALLLMALPRTARIGPSRPGSAWFGSASPVALAVAGFGLFNADMAIWHVPFLYDLTLQNEGIHIVEHLTFMAVGLLFWLPVLSPIVANRLTHPGQALYLFANLFPEMAIGILFTFLPTPLYHPYVLDPRLWGISPVTDQQIGGLIMWMPGSIVFLVAIGAIMVRWFDSGSTRPSSVTLPRPEGGLT